MTNTTEETMTTPTDLPDQVYEYHQEAQMLGHAAAYGGDSTALDTLIKTVRQCRLTAHGLSRVHRLMAGAELSRQALELTRARVHSSRSAENLRHFGMAIEVADISGN